MEITHDNSLAIGWVVSRIRPEELTGTFFLKGTYRLRNGTPAELLPETESVTGDEFYGSGESLRYPSDFAPWKEKADLLLTGSCYPPEGKPSGTCPVSFSVGKFEKKLGVVGDRVGEGDPAPFVRMPLRYERSYGGPSVKENPFGRGHDAGPRPNVITKDLQLKNQPVGFGPLHPGHPERSAKLGTYDKTWQEKYWPWFPPDFNWSYYNAAPRNQRLEGYLKGDETISLLNLHPEHPIFETALPGLRARCFVGDRFRDEERFREVPLSLDTLWIDTDEEKLVLVWRGRVPVSTLKLTEIEDIYFFSEPLSSPKGTLEEHRKKMVLLRDGPQEPEEEASPPENIEEEAAEMEARQEAKEEEVAAAMGASVTPEVAGETESLRDSVQVRFAEKESFAGNDLSDQDLSGLDLSGADFSGARLVRANLSKCVLKGANLTGAYVYESDLTDADLSGACLEDSDFMKSNLTRARLIEAKLTGADLSQTEMQGSDLTRVSGEGVDFNGSKLGGASFREAKLNSADFSMADLSKADFTKGVLKASSFEEATGPGIIMTEADLTDINASEGADFSGGRFQKIQGESSNWEGANLKGADFTGAVLDRADFTAGNLDGAQMDRAELTKAAFMEASLEKTSLMEANLFEAAFERANLTEAFLCRANLCGADFWDATLTGTNLLDANLDNTQLEKI